MTLSSSLRVALAGIFFLLLSGLASAQERLRIDKVDLKDVKIDTQKTPEFSLDGGNIKKTPRNREWLEIDVELEITGKSDANDYLDSLVIKYYVVLDDKNNTMLTATVNHINVPMNEEIWSAVYIAPSTIEKIVGKGNANARAIQGYAIEVLHAGEKKAEDSNVKGKGRWWLTKQGTSGLLLPKSKTPFQYLWWDRYAEEKPAG